MVKIVGPRPSSNGKKPSPRKYTRSDSRARLQASLDWLEDRTTDPPQSGRPLLEPIRQNKTDDDRIVALATLAVYPALARNVLGAIRDTTAYDAGGILYGHILTRPHAQAIYDAMRRHYDTTDEPVTSAAGLSEWARETLEDAGLFDSIPAITKLLNNIPRLEAGQRLWQDVWAFAVHSWSRSELNFGISHKCDTTHIDERSQTLLAAGRFADRSVQQLRKVSAEDYLSRSRKQAYLVDRVLPRADVGAIGGADKTCKSALGVDLTLSAASGRPFLGRWEVPRPVRAGIIAVEGGDVLYETLARVGAAKGIDVEALMRSGQLCISRERPILLVPGGHEEIERFICENELESLVLDSLYLIIVGADQSTLTRMADPLGKLSDICRRTGCSITAVHHITGRSGKQLYRPPSHRDLCGAGISEWVRYWTMVGPRRDWNEKTGEHWLNLVLGSSGGGGQHLHLDIREGLATDPGGRIWGVEVSDSKQPKMADPMITAAVGDVAETATADTYSSRVLKNVVAMQKRGKLPASRSEIIKAVGGQRGPVLDAITELLASGQLLSAKRATGRPGITLP